MVLKDWKKWDEKPHIIQWVNKKSEKKTMKGMPELHYKDIFIIKYNGENTWTFVDRTKLNHPNKEFKTKQQALAFAKAYMRTH